jgi:predicted amidohydrolase YtcJ
MTMRTSLSLSAAILLIMLSCNAQKKQADLILSNGKVYTVDKEFGTAEAIAIKDHRIIAVGSSQEIAKAYVADEVRNLEGAFVYPGWIDAHCHFFGYGMNLNAVDVAGTESVDEIIEALKAFRKKNPGAWITGRGWDQNDWEVQDFPNKNMLDKHFPKTPILLRRIDGHAAWANSLALEMAGVTADSKVGGGTVMLSNGEPNGILVDNAIGLVARKIPQATEADMINALLQAEKNCFSVGLTSVQDAGISKQVVELIDSLHQAGALKIRMNTWLSPSEANFTHFVEKGPYQTAHLSINTVKLFTDGALGSRGARMIEPYSDDPGNLGLYVTPLEQLKKFCQLAYQNNFAVATHCIGDAANRETLKIYADILGGENDRRWRIEHAQIIHPDDFHYFGDYNIIPSVQTSHATSDMYWAEQRVGSERILGAYAYKQLLEQNGWLPNGSDFPVEQINPLFGFYAAVVRKDQTGFPEGGFQPENAISREQALRAMTIWAARSGKEEDLKGSIEVGKLADLVITSIDLMSAPDEALFGIKVQSTYSGGELVYEAGLE